MRFMIIFLMSNTPKILYEEAENIDVMEKNIRELETYKECQKRNYGYRATLSEATSPHTTIVRFRYTDEVIIIQEVADENE